MAIKDIKEIEAILRKPIGDQRGTPLGTNSFVAVSKDEKGNLIIGTGLSNSPSALNSAIGLSGRFVGRGSNVHYNHTESQIPPGITIEQRESGIVVVIDKEMVGSGLEQSHLEAAARALNAAHAIEKEGRQQNREVEQVLNKPMSRPDSMSRKPLPANDVTVSGLPNGGMRIVLGKVTDPASVPTLTRRLLGQPPKPSDQTMPVGTKSLGLTGEDIAYQAIEIDKELASGLSKHDLQDAARAISTASIMEAQKRKEQSRNAPIAERISETEPSILRPQTIQDVTTKAKTMLPAWRPPGRPGP